MIVNPRDVAITAGVGVLVMLATLGVIFICRIVAEAKRPKKIMAPESKYGRNEGYPPLTRPLPPPPKAPADPRGSFDLTAEERAEFTRPDDEVDLGSIPRVRL